MKPFFRFIALILLLAALLSLSTLLTACSPSDTPPDAPNKNPPDTVDETIISPPPMDYERAAPPERLEYQRPDFAALTNAFVTLAGIIKDNEISYDEQIEKIGELEEPYSNALTMYSLAQIYSAKDVSNKGYAEEYEYVSTSYPAFVKAIEDMYVAAANSPYAENFETDYFGEGLIEKYKDGGSYTEGSVPLLADEAALEAEFSALSYATVSITYKNKTDTTENVLAYYESTLGKGSTEYARVAAECIKLYEQSYNEAATDILVSLVKVRRLIADELGYDTYTDYAYKQMGHDYSQDDAKRLIADIAQKVIPVYSKLYSYVFYPYFVKNTAGELSRAELINSAYEIVCGLDEDLLEAYSYMLTYNLYDIAPEAENRNPGAFETYLHDYEAPYLFISTSSDATDYSTLFHEFGHFYDDYSNYGAGGAMDILEISSQGLELLSLTKLAKIADEHDAVYLKYDALCSALETLIFQGFYADVEHAMYELKYSDITESRINSLVVASAKKFSLNTDYVKDASVIIIPHVLLYPFYVQSYCTSILPSLELYFMEIANEGAGFSAYKHLVAREENEKFPRALERSGLTSPFAEDYVERICNEIHYLLCGTYYFTEMSNDQNAA